MNKFAEAYNKLQNPMPSLPFYGLGEIVCYGGFKYEVTAFEPDEKEECWIYDLKRVDGTDKTEEGINELGLAKSFSIEKSEDAVHTPKWDRCVQQVKENGDADPYAVCTAMLGEEALKSMSDEDFDETMKMYMRKLGISGAGPVPNSLLACQDLEPETRKSFQKSGTDLDSFSVWYYDKGGAQKCAVFGHLIDAEAFARMVDAMGFKDVSIMKSAEEMLSDGSLLQNIKDVNLKRQKATIEARQGEKPTTKSFKDYWKKNINEK